VIEYTIFLCDRERNEIWHKGSLGDEDDRPNLEYTHSREKACDTMLDEK